MRIFLIFLLVCSLLIGSASAMGLNPSDRFYYLDVNTQELGQLVILIPITYGSGCLALDDSGVPVNVTTQQITGYVYTDSSFTSYRYQIRWSPLGSVSSGSNVYSIYASYRYTNGSYSYYTDLTITSVNSTNLDLDSGPVVESSVWYVLIVLILAALLLFSVLRRRR